MKFRITFCTVVLLAALCAAWGQDNTAPSWQKARIMIVVPEFHKGRFALIDEDLFSRATWILTGYLAGLPSLENQLIKQFVDAGYSVVDQTQYASMRYTPEMEAVLKDPTGAAARSLTANAGAEVLIVGKATSEVVGTVGNTTSARAVATLRAVRTQGDATIIAATDTTGSGADISGDVAFVIAGRKAGDIAAAELLPRVGQRLGGPTTTQALTQTAEANGAGHKVRVAVMPFEDRSQWGKADWNLGQAIPDLITNELMKQSNLELVDRSNLNQVVNNQGVETSGLFDGGGQREELGTLVKADVGIFGRITEFTTKQRGGVVIPVFGGIGVGQETAIVCMLLKVVDLKTGTVLATGEAKGDAQAALIGGGYLGLVFGGAEFDKSSAGRATRKAIAGVVDLVIKALPMTCPACGAKVQGGDAHCPQCGADLTPAAPAACPNPKCKAPIRAGDKFCRKCGQKL
jgi:curli biogenesis system outer membrane secretion channel CsgG